MRALAALALCLCATASLGVHAAAAVLVELQHSLDGGASWAAAGSVVPAEELAMVRVCVCTWGL